MEGSYLKELIFRVTADTKGAILGLNGLEKELEKLNVRVATSKTGMEKFVATSASLGKMAGIGIAAFTGIALAAEHFSKQIEIANAQVENTLTNMGFSAEKVMPYVIKLENTFTNLGKTTGDTAEAFSILTTGLKSPTAAMEYMGTVADFTAKQHMTMAEGATAVVKASQGMARAFKPIGVTFDEGNSKAEKFTIGMKKVQEATKGAAETFAATASGSLDVMKAKTEAAAAVLGQAMAPILVRIAAFVTAFIIPALNNMARAFENNKTQIKFVLDALVAVFLGSKIIAGIMAFITVLGFLKEAYYAVKVAALAAATSEMAAEAFSIVGLGAVAGGVAAVIAGLKLINGAIDGIGNSIDSKSGAMGDYKKIVASMLADMGKVNMNLDTTPTGQQPKLASDWNASAKAIQSAAIKIQSSLKDLNKLNVGQSVADLAINPLTKSLNDATKGALAFGVATDKLITLTKNSAAADKAYVSSMNDVTTAGVARTQALKNAADVASASAVQAATDADSALQDIMNAQKAYANEVISTVNAMRSAFQNATNFNIGTTASNITAAKKNLADAQAVLADAQAKFKTQVSTQAYDNVITNTALPVFTAEQRAVEKAQEDLAIALGTKQSPFLATAEELKIALQASYDNSVQLAQTAGNLSAAGFSQEFINQIISQGPDLGVQLGKAILSTAPAAQSSMSDLFNKMTDLSKTGVNNLSIQLNQNAINVMDTFIKNFGNISISPIDKLVSAITTRIDAMVTSITEAIKAIMAQLAALGQIAPTTPTIQNLVKGVKDPNAKIDPVTQSMINTGTGYVSSTGVSSNDPNAGTFAQYYQGTSGGLYGSTPAVSTPTTPYNPLSGMTVTINNYQPTDTATAMSDAAWGARTSLDVNYTLPSAASAAVTTGIMNKLNTGGY